MRSRQDISEGAMAERYADAQILANPLTVKEENKS
jgi:hypothetical protein